MRRTSYRFWAQFLRRYPLRFSARSKVTSKAALAFSYSACEIWPCLRSNSSWNISSFSPSRSMEAGEFEEFVGTAGATRGGALAVDPGVAAAGFATARLGGLMGALAVVTPEAVAEAVAAPGLF